MISRRQYFSIVLTMAAVFLLFMGTQIGRERWESEDPSAHATETGLTSDTVWTAPAEGTVTERNVTGVVFFGAEDSPEAKTYARWARYAKRTLIFADSLDDQNCTDAELLLVPGDALAENTEALEILAESGVNILCLSVPDEKEIRNNKSLKKLLGIRSIHRTRVHLDGMHLFGGFLLGGERIYKPEDEEEEEERQDLPLDTPWYIVRAGTETYMRGILGEEDQMEADAAELKNEDMPAIIWRHHVGNAELFAVNGTYMENADIAGGIVQAALSKIETTSIYPVVDAQVFSLVDFPALTDENSEQLLPIYGRKMTGISRDIILPSLVFLPNRYGVAVTAFASAQFDYGDEQNPEDDLAEYFRKEMHTLHGELALSLRRHDDTPVAKRVEADAATMAGGEEAVEIASVWAEPEDVEALAGAGHLGLSNLRTVLTLPEKDEDPLAYISRDVTLQRFTGNAATHTYMQDIALMCRETSMGYDSCYCDFSSIWQPKTEEDRWQKLSDKVLSNLITYRKPFEAFERVTASDCDAKLRRYLMQDYDYKRDDETIELTLPLLLTESSFVIRLNDEQITEMEGGTYTEIEEGAYLLRVNSSYVKLRVGASEPLSTLSEREDTR